MSLNKKRTESLVSKNHANVVKTQGHTNHMGGVSYDIGHPITNLRLAANSCFFGEPKYYGEGSATTARPGKSSPYGAISPTNLNYIRATLGSVTPTEWSDKTPKNLIESAIDKALDFSVEETLKEAVRLRNADNIRVTPQVILVRAANHKGSKGTNLIRTYAKQIISRADEPAICMAYQIKTYGKPVPNSLKRACADKISSLSEYSLGKYRMESREVKTVDVVNLVHPKANAGISKLVKGELKQENTWENMRSAGVPWETCLDVMGHMALLRNLRNLIQAKVDSKLFLDKLLEGVATGKQLPFRYWSAYNAVKDLGQSAVVDVLHQCLELSYANVPKFAGRTMSLCDNSGSAQGTTTSEFGSVQVNEIANLTAVVTAKNSQEGFVGVFGDRLETFSVPKTSSTFDLLDKANRLGERIGQGTEAGIWTFWDNAIKNSEHWDNVFIYSDMQAGHGGLYGNPNTYRNYIWPDNRNQFIDVPKLIMEYRRKVNLNVNVFLVQVAGYTDTITPQYFDKTYILGGWSGGILNFAHSMIKNNDNS